MKPRLLLLFCGWLTTLTLTAQDQDTDGIYVWEFKFDNHTSSYTQRLTKNYESLLIQRYGGRVISRSNSAFVKWHQRNEITLNNLPSDLVAKFKEKGARILVWGAVEKHKVLDQIFLTVEAVDIFTLEKYFLKIDEVPFTDGDLVREAEALQRFIPPSLPVKRRTLPVISEAWAEQLTRNANPWQLFQVDYVEDFSNFRRSDFLHQLWPLNPARDFWSGVDDGAYCYKIKTSNFMALRYIDEKYLDKEGQNRPFAVHVKLTDSLTLQEGAYGRGILLRYSNDKGNTSYYAFLLNDDGELTFIKKKYGAPANSYEVLDKLYQEVAPGKICKLGVVDSGDAFYLFVNEHFVKMIRDDELSSGLYGVIAHGKGIHQFDNVIVYRPLE